MSTLRSLTVESVWAIVAFVAGAGMAASPVVWASDCPPDVLFIDGAYVFVRTESAVVTAGDVDPDIFPEELAARGLGGAKAELDTAYPAFDSRAKGFSATLRREP